MFDSAGTFVRWIGQQGSANGDYETVADVTVGARNGAITVLDLGNFRLLAYDSVGTLMSATQILLYSSFTSAMARPHGAVFFKQSAGTAYGQAVTATFESLDSSGRWDPMATVRAPAIELRGSKLQGMLPFFLPRASWAVDPDGGVTYSSGAGPRVERYDSLGRPQLLLGTGVPAHRVTAAEVSAEERWTLQQFTGSWRERTLPFVKRAAALASETLPLFSAVRVLDDGTIWLREGSGHAADSVRWDVFKPSGAWLGWTELPGSVRILGGYADRLLVAAYDHPHRPIAEWVYLTSPSRTSDDTGWPDPDGHKGGS